MKTIIRKTVEVFIMASLFYMMSLTSSLDITHSIVQRHALNYFLNYTQLTYYIKTDTHYMAYFSVQPE